MSTYSIYIPRVSGNFGQETMSSLFYQYSLGMVKRIDFVKVENSSFQSAFVHFHYLMDTDFAKKVKDVLEKENGSYRLQIYEGGEYWILLKNKKPIEDSVLNIHQVTDMMQKMEKQLQEQADMILLLQEEIRMLKEHETMKTPERLVLKRGEPVAPIKQRMQNTVDLCGNN
jgi:FtsZ-binding cell division protein ZapB